MLAHDWLCGLRGGERVLSEIAEEAVRGGAEIAGLLTMFDDGKPLTPVLDRIERLCSGLGRLPGAATALRRHLLPFYPLAVAQLSRKLGRAHRVKAVDLVISTSSAAVKGLEMPLAVERGGGGRVPHLSYIHTPARYLWSQAEQYARGSMVRRVGLAAFGPGLRRWDAATARLPDMLLANSAHTARLIKEVWGRESRVVHPGVATEFFTPFTGGDAGATNAASGGRRWLVVSALEPYKRVDIAIRAAAAAGRALVVVGRGTQELYLRSIAGPMVTFAGRVDEEGLRSLYRESELLLHPQVEDFGMSAVEAQACGLPVVALGSGGALETVMHGVSGVHFQEQTVASILSGVEACAAAITAGTLSPAACVAQASKFSRGAFAAGLTAAVAEVLGTGRS